MAKYRNKSIIVEAFIYGETDKYNLPIWAKKAIMNGTIKAFSQYGGDLRWAEIETSKGTMIANQGDYIVKGITGELYPCKSNIFHKTYEEV